MDRAAIRGVGGGRPAGGNAARQRRVADLRAGRPQHCYNRIFSNFRTWKRYQGGLAQQVFTYDFDTKKLNQVTDWKGTTPRRCGMQEDLFSF
ncbi:MAG: hypothetical protein WDN04_07425 [Rhodospirillales bacterium]